MKTCKTCKNKPYKIGYCYNCLVLKDKQEARGSRIEYKGYWIEKYSRLTPDQQVKQKEKILRSSCYKKLIKKSIKPFTFHPSPQQIATVFLNLSKEEHKQDFKSVTKLIRQKLEKLSPYA